MRVIRFFILLLGVAIAAAGCARQPVAYMAYPTPTSGNTYPTSGIDNVVYGMSAPYTPATVAGSYAPSPTGYVPSPTRAPPLYGYAPSRASGVYAYAPTAPVAQEAGYTLDSGDRLRIVVFGQDGLTNSYAVDVSGNIDMPLIGAVAARGLTTDQLASHIADKLRNGFIREPHVAVEVEAYRPFFILGEVTQPGQYPYVANMTAETAVAIAGGFTPRAFRKSVTLNRNYNGRPMRIAVPLTFPLRPGDTINVQERWF
jgi:polysaccharide biosynthesis/export protein